MAGSYGRSLFHFCFEVFYLNEDEVGSRISLNAQESCLNFVKKIFCRFSVKLEDCS